MTRATLWVLLPWCIVGALILVSQGVVQNFKPYDHVRLVEPQKVVTTDSDGKAKTTELTEQVIAQGPVASQEIIKQLGTNGGGFIACRRGKGQRSLTIAKAPVAEGDPTQLTYIAASAEARLYIPR